MVRRWMQQRIQVTKDFEGIVTPRASEEPADELSRRINAFCQTLVDYVSAGHFEIYNELITEAREFNDGSLSTAMDLCKAIVQSTDLALEFNDKYENDKHCTALLAGLPRDMVELGNVLNLRFELEDKLISTVHDCHRSMVA
ncbi:MAG: Rsd/AlgQ family anti-sigma factor [Pseudomonadales bacterium]|nr:Rsd/AlgQ family anti-sigma factor [Pseudomonadales bacterium]